MNKKVQYFVNEEKGVVVCVIDDWFKKYRGVARCNRLAGDVFDAEVGRKAAFARANIAKLKVYRRYNLDDLKACHKHQLELIHKMISYENKIAKSTALLNEALGH